MNNFLKDTADGMPKELISAYKYGQKYLQKEKNLSGIQSRLPFR